jgi:hypothetical protein
MPNIPTSRPVPPTSAIKAKRPRAINRKKDGEAQKKLRRRLRSHHLRMSCSDLLDWCDAFVVSFCKGKEI